MNMEILVLAQDEEERGRAASTKRMDVDGGLDEAVLACPGDLLTDDAQFMRGHGTFVEDDTLLYSSLAGTVERVNKLISVHPRNASLYQPEIGDVVIGRILEVGPKRWRVHVNGKLDGVLLLSSVNLPGGVQRRKQESDALQMRSFFAEGDMLVAEVQQFFGDGAVSMHTRSLKYGKLRNGSLVTVPPSLIQRTKSHFHEIPGTGVHVILGLNGMIWVSKHMPEMTMEQAESNPDALYTNENAPISEQVLRNIARVCNCIRIMAKHHIAIQEATLRNLYELSLEVSVKDLLRPENARRLAQLVMQ